MIASDCSIVCSVLMRQIVGASRIAGMLMGNKPSHDRTGSGSVSQPGGLPRAESLTGSKSLIPPSPSHATSPTSASGSTTPNASPPPTPGSTTTKLSGSLKINLTSPTGAAISAAAATSGGSSGGIEDAGTPKTFENNKPAAEEEKKRDETRALRIKVLWLTHRFACYALTHSLACVLLCVCLAAGFFFRLGPSFIYQFTECTTDFDEQ